MISLRTLNKINDLFKFGDTFTSHQLSKKTGISFGICRYGLKLLEMRGFLSSTVKHPEGKRYVRNGFAEETMKRKPTKSRKFTEDIGFFNWHTSEWMVQQLIKERKELLKK